MREEFLNLWVLEDREAEARVGCRIEAREKLHHWPLSWVEKWVLSNGRTVVYKSQCAEASVEKAVYEKVQAPFLLPLLHGETCRGCDMMIFPYCPPSDAAVTSASQVMELSGQCGELLRAIGEMPVFFDLSSADRMISQTETACLSALDQADRQTGLSSLFRWMEAQVPRLYAGEPIGLVHGDINAGNLIREGGAVRYILDWQRPMLAPLALEQALALRLAGYKSEDRDWGHMALACHILWYAWAYVHVLPIEGVRQTVLKLIDGFPEGH